MPGAVAALVPAAGLGVRLGAGAKAFVLLRGEPLLRHAVRRLLGSECVDRVVVAVAADQHDSAERCTGDLGRPVRVVTGGAERTDSVAAALAAAGDPEFVLVHDAARCLVPAAVIRTVVESLRAGHRAVLPVLPVTDTLKHVDAGGNVCGTVDRSSLRAAQTPQGFATELLHRAYRARRPDPVTDDAALVEALGEPVLTVPGHQHAFKITTSRDLQVAETVLSGCVEGGGDGCERETC